MIGDGEGKWEKGPHEGGGGKSDPVILVHLLSARATMFNPS